MIAVSGVRMSWLIWDRKFSFSWLVFAAIRSASLTSSSCCSSLTCFVRSTNEMTSPLIFASDSADLPPLFAPSPALCVVSFVTRYGAMRMRYVLPEIDVVLHSTVSIVSSTFRERSIRLIDAKLYAMYWSERPTSCAATLNSDAIYSVYFLILRSRSTIMMPIRVVDRKFAMSSLTAAISETFD